MKSVLVTGASSGIGRAFSVSLAKRGYRVTAVARNETLLKELVAELGSGHEYVVADLSIEGGQDLVVKKLTDKKFDLLINNAGVGTVGRFTDVESTRQLAMLHLNTEALVRLSYAFLTRASQGDALINVSSALAFMPTPGMALYCATKAFVTSFSESLWFEYKPRGVYVQGLCPGITETHFQVSAGGKKEDLPKGLSQTPEHVVEVALSALESRRQPTVLTGFKNKMFAGMSRILPRKSIVSMTGSMVPLDRR